MMMTKRQEAKELNVETQLKGTEIAVIGMAGRFPGARNLDEFWQNLCNGVESIRFPSDEELRARGVDEALLRDSSYVKASAALDGMELFDAAFFGYTPREAELMDPQHRILLECAWEALEHAGYDPEAYRGSTGVFVGATTNTYLLFNLVSNRELLSALDQVQIDVSNGADFLATRVSYKFNLKGPSYTVQTACSTSLVAIHIACQSLLNEECDMALAGGVSIHAKHLEGYRYLEGGIVSPDGHCRAFDAQAAGTIFGSGTGIVVLKRLKDAIAAGDHIHAVVLGSAINNDGAVKVGYTAPSVEGQAAVITEALAAAGVQPDAIRYIETHGTGTQMGDPIEIRALTKAFHAGARATNYCAIGSVKSNIGHLAGAAGVSSFVKTVLMLEHRLIPPSLNFERPNPEVDFANSPFYVNTRLTEWKSEDRPRRAGVSSFGVGGTNAHVILQEAPVLDPAGASRPAQLLLLSAKTGTALEAATLDLTGWLKKHADLNLADVAYTLQTGRQAFSHRRMVVCRDLDDAALALETRDPLRVFTSALDAQDRSVVFMFPGQGAQYVNMARELYQIEPVLREHMDRCAELLRPYLGLDVRELLYPDADQVEEAGRKLDQTFITQPALFAVEYALAQLWMSWGVQPRAMLGHSIGEYVAACLAEVFSLGDALALVAARGRLIQELPPGAMLAVSLSEAALRPFLGPDLAIAAVNAPSLCAVSGAVEAIQTLQERLSEQGVTYRSLHTSHAFHSVMMDPILARFAEHVERVRLNPPKIPYISNVSGDWIEAEQAADPAYWVRHLRQTVRFAEGLRVLWRKLTPIFLEVGPGRTLGTLVQQHSDQIQGQVALASIRHPHDPQSDMVFLLNALGRLWLAGVRVNWSGFYAQERRHRLPLPTYPFERRRYWIEPHQIIRGELEHQAALDKKPDIADWFYVPSWKRSMPPRLYKPDDLARDRRCWLIFADEHGLASDMAGRLTQASHPVVQVKAGEQFGRIGEGVYTLDPRQPDDYTALFRELSQAGQLPDLIVHLWNVTPDREQAGLEFFDQAQDAGFYSLLFLAQALGEQGVASPLQLWVVSNNVHKVESADAPHPEKATLLGACKVIPQEFPNVACHSLDIVLGKVGNRPGDDLVGLLVAEIMSNSFDAVVAYRGRQRWVQAFEPTRLEGNTECIGPLRENGVYLITGGLDSIGWVLTDHLARSVRARLAVVENVSFPPRDQWEQWLTTHSAQDSICRKIYRVRILEEESGGQVLALSADVADEIQMQRAITQAVERLGRINGVIHAAGSMDSSTFRTIRETDYAECKERLERRVRSLFVLGKVLSGQELDFCLLNSSLSSVLGGLGQVAHAATSLFMDVFAERQSQTSPAPWLSVNWDVWQFEQEDGIAALGGPLAQFAISPAEGIKAVCRILSRATSSQIVVSTGNLQTRLDQWSKAYLVPGPSQAAPSLHPRPQLPVPYVSPRNELEQTLANTWQKVLGIDQVGIDDNFFEVGGNSLIAVQAVAQLKETLQIQVLAATLYQKPTIRSLAELLAQGEDQSVRQRAEKLARRKEEFSRHRQILQQRRK